MLTKELDLFLQLDNKPKTVTELAKMLKMSKSYTSKTVSKLEKKGLAERKKKGIVLRRSAKTSALINVSAKWNLHVLLKDSNEEVLLTCLEPVTAEQIIDRAKIKTRTVWKALSSLQSIGAVVKVDSSYSVVPNDDLKMYLAMEQRDRIARIIEPTATLIYSNSKILKRVKAGETVEGTPTAFSMFSVYGVDVNSPWDYYVQPKQLLDIEDIFVHAVICSEDARDVAFCCVFYYKNRNRIDPDKLMSVAKGFGRRAISLLLDIQNYMRYADKDNPAILNKKMFLPWKEFSDRYARVYGLPVSHEREASTTALFQELDRHVKVHVNLYVFGGACLVLMGLKNVTKDYDFVVPSQKEYKMMHGALTLMGFKQLNKKLYSFEDKWIRPSAILVRKGHRIDLFQELIVGQMKLSEEMIKRSTKYREFTNLTVYRLAPEDVFLLKGVAGREGDIDDMRVIVERSGALNWKLIMDELLSQEKTRGDDYSHSWCFKCLKNLQILNIRARLKIPVMRLLLRHCLEVSVKEAKARGRKGLKEITEHIHATRNLRDLLTNERIRLAAKRLKIKM
jgi:predicted transcriptional regulator